MDCAAALTHQPLNGLRAATRPLLTKVSGHHEELHDLFCWHYDVSTVRIPRRQRGPPGNRCTLTAVASTLALAPADWLAGLCAATPAFAWQAYPVALATGPCALACACLRQQQPQLPQLLLLRLPLLRRSLPHVETMGPRRRMAAAHPSRWPAVAQCVQAFARIAAQDDLP